MDYGTLKWFCVDGRLFEPLFIQLGVPQLILLGPMLFLLFINDFLLALETDVTVIWVSLCFEYPCTQITSDMHTPT